MIVQMSLIISFFVVLNEVFLQQRGSCIGSQISPPVCNVAVAFDEYMWTNAFNLIIKSAGFFTRYVDNRAIIACKSLLNTYAYKPFMSLDFYRNPIELERLDDNVLLGFEILVSCKQCKFIIPKEQWQYRSLRSAGTLNQNLSGLTSRLFTIMRGSFPKSLAKPVGQQLCNRYIEAGFNHYDVQRIFKQVLNKCRD